LLDYLLENDADVVKDSWQDVTSRGPGWLSRLRQGWKGLNARFPEQQFEQRMGPIMTLSA